MDYITFSDIGKREINEDSADVICRNINGEDCSIFVLADGLGGHGRGEVASGLVVETSRELFEKINSIGEIITKSTEQDSNTEAAQGIIGEILEESQRRLIDLQKQEHAKDEMKTTAVILTMTEHKIQWGHIGDSRLYYFRKKKLIGRTLDHSVPQILVSAGELRESKIRNHPDRNRLLRVLGAEWERQGYQISDVIERKGDEAFLLCSDGFWENIVESQMQWTLLWSKTADEWMKKMKEIVRKNGEGKDMDNNTAIVIWG